MGITFKIAKNKLPDFIAAIPELSDKIVRDTTFAVGNDAREHSPFKSGHMKSTHHEEFPAPMTGIVAVGADYAGYVHDGARGRAARPWLAEAMMRHFPAFEQAFRALEEMAK